MRRFSAWWTPPTSSWRAFGRASWTGSGSASTTLHERNPRVVLCSISGYGQDGPYRDHAGHDLNYAAVAGVLRLGEGANGAPVMPGLQVGDLGGGALDAALAIMVALHHAARTGEGQHCDISMVDGLISWASGARLATLRDRRWRRSRATGVLTGRYPCYRIYACADGFLSVGTLEPKFWHAFVRRSVFPEVADRGFAEGAEGEQTDRHRPGGAAHEDPRAVADALAGLDVCVEPVLDMRETFEHPQVRSRGMRLDAGDGRPTAQTGFPIRLRRSPATFRRGAPGYGEHTDEVLAEAGYDADDGRVAARGGSDPMSQTQATQPRG